MAVLKGKKLIGVCVSKITEDECAEFLHALYLNTLHTDYRLMVFNSYAEMYAGEIEGETEKTIFHALNFDCLDALLIADQCFTNKQIVERLIADAKAHGLPVVVLEKSYEGCSAVLPGYSDTFVDMLRHVIENHGAKKLRYLAGLRGEYHSELRKMLFFKTLEEYGLTAYESEVAYCDYWEGPVMLQVDRWVETDNVPDAVVCANDVMAAAACKQLKQHGLRVPEDVVVTGFDGLDYYAFHQPTLTTCKRNTEGLAKMAFAAVEKALAGEEPCSFTEPYLLVKGESCGCPTFFDVNTFRQSANYCNEQLLDSQIHEKQVFSLFGSILRNTGLYNLDNCLRAQLLNGSAVCMADTFIDATRSVDAKGTGFSLTDKMVVASSSDDTLHGRTNTRFLMAEMYPSLPSLIDGDDMYLFQELYAETEICGYYAIRTTDVLSIANRMHRLVNVMNGVVSLIASRMKQEYVSENMLEMRWRDALTGLMNLKGISVAVNEKYEELKEKYITLTIYTLPHYQFVCENHGLAEADEMVRFAGESLQKVNPANAFIARTENDKFLVINVGDDEAALAEINSQSVARLRLCFDEYNKNSPKDYAAEFNNGSTVVEPGWNNDLISLMKAADSELYLNRLKQNSTAAHMQRKTSREDYQLLDLLLKKNLFQYHFQPIVSARTGEICAYEALMRTSGDIKMSPLEILRIAQEHFRLYDVEYATMNNVMAYVEEHYELFKGKRVFINSIPGFFLNEDDRQKFIKRYSHLFHMCTIEITERSEITDENEVGKIRGLSDGTHSCQLAIDDYGTGFSNIVNLLRYSPNVIKIDHYLIEDIQNDSNKQMFVKNTIEFARMNRIATLAEGVETYQEMKKIIELGVDYIQGYYTARPSPVVIQAIDSEISSRIIEENLKNVRVGNESHTYHARNNETIQLLDLALKKYTNIEIHGGTVHIVGEKNHPIGMIVKITDGSNCVLELENVNMFGPNETTIQLGFDARCELTVIGDCTLQKEGISVPATSTLVIGGEGNLDVQNTRNNGVGIGASGSGNYGSIVVDMGGKLNVFSAGDQVVCIGGGFGGENSSVHILRGKVHAEAKAIFGVAIGSRDGHSNVHIEKTADVRIRCAGNELAGIGTEDGMLNVLLEGRVRFYGEGDKIVGIGALAGGAGQVRLESSLIDVEGKGSNFIGCGSITGGVEIVCHSERVRIYGEGETTCGLGSINGYGSVKVDKGIVSVELLASERIYLGGRNTPVTIDSGNIFFDPEALPVTAKNSLGQELKPVEIHEDSYSRHISGEMGEYDYTASRDEESGRLCVYLPA